MNTNINNNPLHPQTNFVQQNTRSTKSRKNWKKRELERQKKRAREREEMQRQFNNLTKPFHKQKLPKDASFLIFSLLDPLMKANCHLVCKSWRFSILLDPLLCNALDLSKLGKETPIKSFFEHFNRLSFYAGDRLVKVSLDLSSFWLDYLSNQQVYETSVCSDLFQTILFKSRATLREISLRFVLEGADFCKFNLSFFPFLNSTLQQLQSYPLLKSIYIEGPSSVSFTLRSDQVRVFEIQDNFEELAEGADNLSDESDDEYEQPEVSHFAPIVECGKRFLGEQAYFSQFETDRYLEDPDQNSSSLVDLLSDSTSTLEILQLDSITVRGSDLWSLVIQCDKLKALRIALPLLIDHAEERAFVELKSPEVSLINSNLQSLSLESYGGFSVEWDLTSPWLGSNVTDLYLRDHPDRYGNYNLMKGPSDLNSLFRNITKTITHIRLRELHPRVGTGGVTNVKMLETLPNQHKSEPELQQIVRAKGR